jgi:hypothetical protein
MKARMWDIGAVHEFGFDRAAAAQPWRPRIEELMAEAARQAAGAGQPSRERDRYDGLRAGLASAIRGTPLLESDPPAGSTMRVGLLTGSLWGSLIRERGTSTTS